MTTIQPRRHGRATTRTSDTTRASEATVLFDPDLRGILPELERARARLQAGVT
jgi:hypothetical protein